MEEKQLNYQKKEIFSKKQSKIAMNYKQFINYKQQEQENNAKSPKQMECLMRTNKKTI